jgi:isopentenyl-diphosphate delta-isomerase
LYLAINFLKEALSMPNVILVDKNDKEIGEAEKLEAHEKGLLHRAFSIFIFNDKKELMLQKRAKSKYHCGNLWTNTVCSHPAPGESLQEATHRRLKEEMGFDCDLEELFSFAYKTTFDNGLTENEIDHVFIGTYNKSPNINFEEADEWKWISFEDLHNDIQKNPQDYTFWFKKVYEKVFNHI